MIAFALTLLPALAGQATSVAPPRVLFLTHSAGFVDSVVRRPAPDQLAHAESCLVEASAGRLELTPTQDCSRVHAQALAEFDAVVVYASGELPIPEEGRRELIAWVRGGGALVGLHGTADTMYEDPNPIRLVGGGHFDGSSRRRGGQVRIEEPGHPALGDWTNSFAIHDETYRFRGFRRHPLRVLLSLDPDSVDLTKGKRPDADYALVWCKDFGQGRMVNTALGHREEVWRDPGFLEHVISAIEWSVKGPDLATPVPLGARALLAEGSLKDWRHAGGEAPDWDLQGDVLEVQPGSGNLFTRSELGSGLYHIEFRLPATPVDNRWQDRGNSGVYLQGRYEVQILDSLGRELRSGDCGGIYGKHVARVDACRPAERWQSYDIRFQAPRFDAAGAKRANARMSVWHNGVLIHDDVEVDTPTAAAMTQDEAPLGPLMLQDHKHPVQFRNLWFLPGAE